MSEETHSPPIMSFTNFMVTLENLEATAFCFLLLFFFIIIIRAKDLTVTLKKVLR